MQNATRSRSFLPKSILMITALGLITALGSYKAAAVDVVTDPVGFITLTTHGTLDSGLAYLGLGMTQIPTNIGLVGAVSGSNVTLSNQTLTAGAFNRITSPVTNAAFFIEITSGSNAGLQDDIISNDATSLTVAQNLPASAVGQNYKIYPHWTIAKVFGASDESGLKQGTSSTADQILVPNPVTQGFATYYYATSSKTLTAGWKGTTTGNTDQSATTMYIDQGFLIKKQTDTNLTVKLVGAVKLGNTQIPLGTANNYAGNVYASSSNTLGTSGLFTDGNQTDSVVAGTSSTGDQVLIHNDVTGAFSTYYYATSSKTLTAGWKGTTTGNTDQSGVQIPQGACVIIKIQTPRPGFDWLTSAPY